MNRSTIGDAGGTTASRCRMPHVGPLVTCYCLAVTSTLLSAGMSAAAGWSRGDGALSSMFWACLGVLATSAAHLLPAAARIGYGWVRWLASVLWAACMVFVVFSHGSYFMTSQQAAGELRGSAVVAPPAAARPQSEVMAHRAQLEADVNALAFPGCAPECSTARRKVAALRSQMAAMDQEAREIAQLESAKADYNNAKERAQRDPALWVMSRWSSVPLERLQLILGLFVGVLLDGVGCVSWMLVFSDRVRISKLVKAGKPATPVVTAPSRNRAPRQGDGLPVGEDSRLAALLANARVGIQSGRLRNSVRAVREHLGCGQRTAMTITRLLKASP